MSGTRSWFLPSSPQSMQRGFPTPQNAAQRRPPPWRNDVAPWGGVIQLLTRRFDRGAAAYAPNFGRINNNPIGAGIVAPNMPHASYGMSARYVNHTIFWVSQSIPTSVPMSGLQGPDQMAALLGTVNVQAAVRTA